MAINKAKPANAGRQARVRSGGRTWVGAVRGTDLSVGVRLHSGGQSAWSVGRQQFYDGIRSIALGVATPMARVRKNEFGAIGRLLDRGAMGIIVPMVNSVEEAEEAVEAVRYPPLGRDGRAARSGLATWATGICSGANDEIFLAIQLETVRAAEIAEDILSVEGIDGCWIGPGDLSMSHGG